MTAAEKLAEFNALVNCTELRAIDFGKHKGKTVRDVDSGYLHWLALTFRAMPHQRALVLEARAELERRASGTS